MYNGQPEGTLRLIWSTNEDMVSDEGYSGNPQSQFM